MELREAEVPGEYRRTAENMDEVIGHADGLGPVTRKRREYGVVMPLIFGGHAEA